MSAHPASGEAERVRVERTIGRLSPAMLAAIQHSPWEHRISLHTNLKTARSLRVRGVLSDDGLSFTPLGLAVRSLLQERNQ